MPNEQLALFPAEDAPKLLPLDELFLDPKNPRLAIQGIGFSREGQEEILKIMVSEHHLVEITDSIIETNAFWRHEPLIVSEEDGHKVVTEGNRRLAAVQILVDPEKGRRAGFRDVPEIGEELRKRLQTLPVVIKPRSKVWDYIGFKHVNGPREWDSIAKARYITRVHDEDHISLSVIAKTIGDRNNTVLRLYHGLQVLLQAEASGYFNRNERYYNVRPFAYSHLWTGLGYDGIRNFLGIKVEDRDKPNPVPETKLPNLVKLCVWLYGRRHEGTPEVEPYVKSQNPDLRKLDEAIASPRGLAALENGRPLEKALEAAMGDEKLLRRSLEEAERGLRDSRAYFSTGFQQQEDILDSVRNIAKLSKSLERELNSSLKEE